MQAFGWALAVLALLILSAMLVLLGLNAARIDTTRVLASAILGVAVVLYAGAGRLITSRRPGRVLSPGGRRAGR